jgi:hypothetical protein
MTPNILYYNCRKLKKMREELFAMFGDKYSERKVNDNYGAKS